MDLELRFDGDGYLDMSGFGGGDPDQALDPAELDALRTKLHSASAPFPDAGRWDVLVGRAVTEDVSPDVADLVDTVFGEPTGTSGPFADVVTGIDTADVDEMDESYEIDVDDEIDVLEADARVSESVDELPLDDFPASLGFADSVESEPDDLDDIGPFDA